MEHHGGDIGGYSGKKRNLVWEWIFFRRAKEKFEAGKKKTFKLHFFRALCQQTTTFESTATGLASGLWVHDGQDVVEIAKINGKEIKLSEL
jgi:hypothetical protein